MDLMQKHCREYLALGWSLVPISNGSKVPRHIGWNKPESQINSIDGLDRISGNVGLAHAFSGTCCIDIDDVDVATQWFAENGIDLNELMSADDAVQIISKPGKAKLLYALPKGMKPLQTKMFRSKGVELRCGTSNGLTVQDVLPPSIHPDTGKPYRWSGDFHNLPVIPDCLLDLWHDIKRTYRSSSQSRANSELLIEMVLCLD